MSQQTHVCPKPANSQSRLAGAACLGSMAAVQVAPFRRPHFVFSAKTEVPRFAQCKDKSPLSEVLVDLYRQHAAVWVKVLLI